MANADGNKASESAVDGTANDAVAEKDHSSQTLVRYWVSVGETRTDNNGAYSFTALPLTDEAGRSYCYRVVAVRPDDAHFAPANNGDDAFDSDFDPALAGDTEGVQGMTTELKVVHPLPNGLNAYGQYWQELEPESWMREADNAVDLGLYWDNLKLNKLFPKLGDSAMLVFGLLVLMLVSGCCVVVARRRRKNLAK